VIADNDSVVIVEDVNETLGTNPKLMASVCAEHALFDVHARCHGIGANVPTYARGTKRLDNGIASTNQEQYIDTYGYSLFNEHLHSDQRTSFMDIWLEECFGHDTPRLANPDLRFMSTSSPDIIKFVQKMYAHLDENKAFHQYQDFCLDADIVAAPWIPANHLDTMIGQAFKTAEKALFEATQTAMVRKTASREPASTLMEDRSHQMTHQALAGHSAAAPSHRDLVGQNRANHTTKHLNLEKCRYGSSTGVVQSTSAHGERKGKCFTRAESTTGVADVVAIHRRRRRNQDHQQTAPRRTSLPSLGLPR
jgi:hypothetical protein